MKFKVGDKVRICSEEKMRELKNTHKWYDIVSDMFKSCGKEVFIKADLKDEYYAVTETNVNASGFYGNAGTWRWHSDLLELADAAPAQTNGEHFKEEIWKVCCKDGMAPAVTKEGKVVSSKL